MSDFVGKISHPGICITKLHASVKGFQRRGGASLQEVNDSVLVFGGADREQRHYNDCLVYRTNKNSSIFEAFIAHGDIPMERSGHQTAAYGKYQFLFGGINFAEESVFNDLYILNTETFEWNYVGESGKEIPSRNSHSMAVIHAGSTNYLVVFGGASPESGPMGDTFYAELPDESDIDTKSVYVTWKELETSSQEHPVAREMHSTCSYRDRMIISGGRSCEGDILSDVWELLSPLDKLSDSQICIAGEVGITQVGKQEVKEQSQDLNVKEGSSLSPAFNNDALIFTVTTPTPNLDSIQINAVSGGYAPSAAAVVEAGTEKEASPAATAESAPLAWRRRIDMELRSPRCAHGSAIICRGKNTSTTTAATTTISTSSDVEALYLVLFGGFTGAGVAGDIALCPLTQVSQLPASTKPVISSLWQSHSSELQPRFGHSMTSISCSTIRNLLTNKRYAPIFSSATKAAAEAWLKGGDEKDTDASAPAAALVFGGVSELTDFGDIWLLLLT